MPLGLCVDVLRGSVGTLVAELVVKPVKRQFGYLRHFNKNVEKFRKQKEELETARLRLERQVEKAENQLQEIEDDVRRLRSKVNDTVNDVENMEREIQKKQKVFGWCPNWWWRYRLSKKLKKKKLVISEHWEKISKFGQTGRVGYSSASTISTIEFLSSKDFVVSKASKKASKQIFEALEDDNVSMIGLWGMGGSGKTTLWCVKLEIKQKSLICSTNKEKKIFLILDNVWRVMNLKEIGIPVGEDHKGCKVLLTPQARE
ncbi:hypothetical protein PTKIN_Ptkin14bG0155500 [Pterospermum kingtungense]